MFARTLQSSTLSKEHYAVVCAFSAKLDILKPVHDHTQRTLQAWKCFSSPCPKSVLLSATVCAAAVTLCAYLLSKACARPCTANSASVSVSLARLARSLSKSVATLPSSTFSKERFAVVCAFPVKLDILKSVHDLTQRTLQAWKCFSSPCPKSVLLSATVCAAAVTHVTCGKL